MGLVLNFSRHAALYLTTQDGCNSHRNPSSTDDCKCCLKTVNTVFKVRGLCGTLTWNQHDDFTTPAGDVESSVSSFAGKFATEYCALPSGAPPEPCTTYTQRRQYAETVCSVIHGPIFQVLCMGCVQSPAPSGGSSFLSVLLSFSHTRTSLCGFVGVS